jgi:hypothetical protein
MTCPLDADAVVPLDWRTPLFAATVRHWPDKDAADRYRDDMHHRDIERAGQPPVVNVTVPGIPGHFTATAGQEKIAYSPDPAPSA